MSEQYNPPMVPAFHRTDVEGFRMWCQYCQMWHLHGKGAGHRVAHCVDWNHGRQIHSPYRNGGYALVDCGPLPEQFRMRGGKVRTDPKQVQPLLDAWLAEHPDWQQGGEAVDDQAAMAGGILDKGTNTSPPKANGDTLK